LCNTDGCYNIITESAAVAVGLHRGRVTVREAKDDGENIRVPERRIAQLLTGFQSSRIKEHRILEVLFPPGDPYWHVDDL